MRLVKDWRLALSTLRRYPHMLPWIVDYLDHRGGDQTSLKDGVPWITYRARSWLRRYLRPDMHGFEWGAGGSTIYLAARMARLVTIEHDGAWLERVRQALASRGLSHQCELRYVPPDRVARPRTTAAADSEEGRKPGLYRSSMPGYEDADFREYCYAIDRAGCADFDLVLVDGRARLGCLHRARERVRPGGVVVLDNSERAAYETAGVVLGVGWAAERLSGPAPYGAGVMSTTIWRRVH